MTALAAGRLTQMHPDGEVRTRIYPVDATAQIYKGGMVGLVIGVAAAAADASGTTVVGIALEDVLGGASDGDETIRVLLGIFRLVGVGLAAATVGKAVFVEDDQTVDDDITAVTNGIKAGMLYEYIAATDGWLIIDGESRGPGAVSIDATDLAEALTLLNEIKGIVNTYL